MVHDSLCCHEIHLTRDATLQHEVLQAQAQNCNVRLFGGAGSKTLTRVAPKAIFC